MPKRSDLKQSDSVFDFVEKSEKPLRTEWEAMMPYVNFEAEPVDLKTIQPSLIGLVRKIDDRTDSIRTTIRNQCRQACEGNSTTEDEWQPAETPSAGVLLLYHLLQESLATFDMSEQHAITIVETLIELGHTNLALQFLRANPVEPEHLVLMRQALVSALRYADGVDDVETRRFYLREAYVAYTHLQPRDTQEAGTLAANIFSDSEPAIEEDFNADHYIELVLQGGTLREIRALIEREIKRRYPSVFPQLLKRHNQAANTIAYFEQNMHRSPVWHLWKRLEKSFYGYSFLRPASTGHDSEVLWRLGRLSVLFGDELLMKQIDACLGRAAVMELLGPEDPIDSSLDLALGQQERLAIWQRIMNGEDALYYET